MNVAIQCCAFDEPDVDQTLEAIASHPVPDWHSVALEAWVTPHDGETLSKARSVSAADVYEAPQGKLSTRNVAHGHAVSSGADVIVSWDADAPPVKEDSLTKLLSHFDRPGVVAVNGSQRHEGFAAAKLFDLATHLDTVLYSPIYGRFSAFTTDAWESAGPFRTRGVDQTDIVSTRFEEERDFRKRLEREGRVIDDPRASVYGEDRRYRCWKASILPGSETPEFCQSHDGGETF